jgi:hypothetical protein
VPDEQDRGFKVQDRRRFTQEGETRDEAPAGAASAAREAVERGPSGPDPETEPTPVNAGPAQRRIDFTTFVFSLGSSALIHLGEAPNPDSGAVERSPELAQETIDLLAMLQEKTKGNLTQEEERFLGALLYDLRMRFVQASGR